MLAYFQSILHSKSYMTDTRYTVFNLRRPNNEEDIVILYWRNTSVHFFFGFAAYIFDKKWLEDNTSNSVESPFKALYFCWVWLDKKKTKWIPKFKFQDLF